MEEIQPFSVIKEKIIKTNDLFSLLHEKTELLQKSQQWVQQLKARLKLGQNEINKLKLKNETLTHDLKTTENNYSCLKKDHEQLTQEYNKLKTETDDNINKLHVNYQLTNQELKECKDQLIYLEKLNLAEDEISLKVLASKKKRAPCKKDKATETETSDAGTSFSFLQKTNEKNKKEIVSLELEVYELKKKLKDVRQIEDYFESTNKANEDEITKLKNECQLVKDHKQKEFDKFSKQINAIKIERNVLQAENEKLKNQNAAYQLTISMMQDSNNSEQVSSVKSELAYKLRMKDDQLCKIKNQLKTVMSDKKKEIDALCEKIKSFEVKTNELQAENKQLKVSLMLGDESVDKVGKEPPLHMTLDHVNNETVNENDKRIRTRSETPSDHQIYEIMKQVVPPICLSPKCGLKNIECDKRDYIENLNENCSDNITHGYSNPNLVRMVKRRRILLKRKRLLAQKKYKQTNLLQALISLKEANISFLIENNCIQPSFIQMPYIQPPKWTPNIVKEPPKTTTNELNCSLECCKSSHMLLKNDRDDENMKLLGFFEVKNETNVVGSGLEEDDVSLQNKKSGKKRKKQMNRDNDKQNRKKFNNIRGKPERKECSTLFEIEEEKDEIECENKNIELENLGIFESEVENSRIECETARNILNCDIKKAARTKKRSSLMSVIKARKLLMRKRRSNLLSLDVNVELPPQDENIQRDIVNLDSPLPKRRIDVKSPDRSKIRQIIATQSKVEAKAQKSGFKRPLCSLRRSPRLKGQNESTERLEETVQECVDYESPQSPTPSLSTDCPETAPALIPLEKLEANVGKLPTSKIEMLFQKLIGYSAEEEALNEIVREFTNQEPQYVAGAILERVAMDYHNDPDTKHYPAPLMTDVQRTMLGFMSKLEKTNMTGVFDSYLTLAEQRLLTSNSLQELAPITRLYLAVCKLQKNITRMRKLCCDVFYFCGDLAVPFFFIVLTSWTEVLPHSADSNQMPLARVLVQIVYMKDCNKPGYNLLALRDLLIKFYGYPTERWEVNEFFKELLHGYLKNPVRSTDFALLLYCKNQPEKWVYETIEEQVKPILLQIPSENFKAHVVILIGNLYNRFSSKSEVNYLPQIRKWFSSLITETTPDVVRRCVYFCLNRLKKR